MVKHLNNNNREEITPYEKALILNRLLHNSKPTYIAQGIAEESPQHVAIVIGTIAMGACEDL